MTTKNDGGLDDDLQDLLAGLLDDAPTREDPPDIVAEEAMEAEAYAEPAPVAAEEDDLDALDRIVNGAADEEIAELEAAAEGTPPPALTKMVDFDKALQNADQLAATESDDDILRGLMSEEGGSLSQAEGELNGTAAEAEAELNQMPAPQGPQIHIPTFTTDEIADAIDIRNFGTLVSLQTKRWHAKVKDRQASKDAATASGADSEAFDTHKRLLVGADEKLKRIHKALDLARAKHYDMTLPWSTVSAAESGKRTGARLLPNTLFMEYTTAMAHAKQEMKTALADFIPAYPGLVNLAKTKLGTRFNVAEYPHASSISNHFDLSFDFMPIPLGDDFKGLAKAQVDKLADAMQRKTNVMLENAMQDAWVRLHETLAHAADRLGNPDALFHGTMVEGLREQAKLLKHLNVVGDQRIEDVRFFIEKNLIMHEAADIRKDEHLRKHLAKQAKAALEMMDEKP